MRTVGGLVEILVERIAHESWAPGGKIPPIRRLAEEFQTTRATVNKALQRLVEIQILEKLPETGSYFVQGTASASGHREPHPLRASRPEFIAQVLRGRIIDGKERAGSHLSSIKLLCREFGCSYATMRSCLDMLQHQGYVQPIGRRYRVLSNAARRYEGANVYLAGSLETLDLSRNVLGLVFVSAMEQELSLMRWGKLRTHLTRHPLRDPAPPEHEVAGYVMVKNKFDLEFRRFFDRHPQVPLVSIDVAEILVWNRRSFPHHENFHNLCYDNHAMGRETALHLRGLGHRKVAFLSHVPLHLRWQKWLDGRVSGVREVYENHMGGEAGVFALSEDHEPAEFSGEGEPILQGLEEASNSAHRHLMDHDAFWARHVHPGTAAILDTADRVKTALRMEPLFNAALKRKELTAWVCCNDELAGLAYAFLHRKGVPVPGGISLCGFDNGEIAYRLGLTSYDMQHNQAGAMAVRCLFMPSEVHSDALGHVRLKGELMPRNSTGPAPGR